MESGKAAAVGVAWGVARVGWRRGRRRGVIGIPQLGSFLPSFPSHLGLPGAPPSLAPSPIARQTRRRKTPGPT